MSHTHVLSTPVFLRIQHAYTEKQHNGTITLKRTRVCSFLWSFAFPHAKENTCSVLFLASWSEKGGLRGSTVGHGFGATWRAGPLAKEKNAETAEHWKCSTGTDTKDLVFLFVEFFHVFADGLDRLGTIGM